MTNDLVRRIVARTTKMPPALEQRNRTPPRWWTDARLGIFVHWTMASVPAYAPRDVDVQWTQLPRRAAG